MHGIDSNDTGEALKQKQPEFPMSPLANATEHNGGGHP